MLLDRAGELLAVVYEFADEAEDAVEGGGCGWGGGHGRNENMKVAIMSRKIFLL